MGVLLAAEFGALAPIDAGLIGLHPAEIDLARDGIGFAGQRRHPKGMDNVGGAEFDEPVVRQECAAR